MSSAVAGSATVVITCPTIHNLGGTAGLGGHNNSPVNCSFASINTPELIHRHRSSSRAISHDDIMSSPSPLFITERKIRINIRGARFETFESTLNKYPDTLLGCSQKRDRFYDFEKKEYKFDRSREAFNAILFYYQSSGKLIRPYDVPEDEFLDDLEFFEIDPWEVAELEYGGENFTKPEKKSLEEEGGSDIEVSKRDKKGKNMYVSCDAILSWPCVLVICVYVLTTCLSSRQEYDSLLKTACVRNTSQPEDRDYLVLERNPLVVVHIACTVWFAFELFLRFTLSIIKLHYVLSFMGSIDIVCVIATFLQIILRHADVCQFGVLTWFANLLRSASFICVFKLSRYSRGLKLFGQTIRACSGQLILSLYCVGICLLVFATIVYYVEYPDNPGFSSIIHTMWYGIVTLTTVGYGDLVPMSVLGRLFGAICSVFGVTIVMAWPATIFVSYFTDIYNHEVMRKKHKKRSMWSRGFYKFKKNIVKLDNGRCNLT